MISARLRILVQATPGQDGIIWDLRLGLAVKTECDAFHRRIKQSIIPSGITAGEFKVSAAGWVVAGVGLPGALGQQAGRRAARLSGFASCCWLLACVCGPAALILTVLFLHRPPVSVLASDRRCRSRRGTQGEVCTIPLQVVARREL